MRNPKIRYCIAGIALVCGCQTSAPDSREGSMLLNFQNPLPEPAGKGVVVSVSDDPLFVVIEFATEDMPTTNSVVSLFRDESHVGTVRITGPNKAPLAIGDIEEGTAETGDEAMITFLAVPAPPEVEAGNPVRSSLLNFGKIVMKNDESNFVLVEFVSGRFPETGSDAGVFRDGEKVGEIRISGPHRNYLTTADIKEGTVQTGDEVRPE